MRFCLVKGGKIIRYSDVIPRRAPLERTGQLIDNLPEMGEVMWKACGWHRIKRTAAPPDTDTTTWSSTHEIVNGVPTVVWVEQPKVVEPHEPSMAEAVRVLDRLGELPALVDMTEEEADAVSVLFPELRSGMEVKADWTYRWNGKLVEIVQDHRVSLEQWTPDTANTLYRVHRPAGTTGWVDGSAYKVGDEVTFNGRKYRCRQAHTAWLGAGWTPVVYSAGWVDLGPV